MAPNPRRIDARLDALYDELPKIECKGLCHRSCGPIAMSARERERIERAAGKKVTCDLDGGELCSLLTDDRKCSVYEIRPLICRMWGVAIGMECEWGCRPERLLTKEEGFEFIRRADEVGGKAPITPEILELLRRRTEP